jgi:hypothetical protein
MPLSGSLRIPLYICLYMSLQRYLYLYAYIWFWNENCFNMPITSSLNMLLHICQYYWYHRCPFLCSYICRSNMPIVYISIKLSWRPILEITNIPFSICLKLRVNKCFFVYPYIRSPKMMLSLYQYYDLQVWPTQYAYICISKDSHLRMPMLGSIFMFPYICPYCGLQGYMSPNAYMWFSEKLLCLCLYQRL